MIDLTTTYMGLQLKNPLVASASPLSKKEELVQHMEKAGVAAIVVYSLFEEQIIHETRELDHYLHRGADSFAEALSYLPKTGTFKLGTEKYLAHLQQIKNQVKIPVIGSLNGVSSGGWVEYAKKMEAVGADAIELNMYYVPTDLQLDSTEIEAVYVKLVSDVKAQITIPLAVKISPFFSALPNFVTRLAEAGADGLVLFNRFYQPDFDLEALEIVPSLTLSAPYEMRLPLRWIALLSGKVKADFALSSGIHDGQGVIKAVMAGAKVAMTTSELLRNGIGRASEILREVEDWLKAHEYSSLQQMCGSMNQEAVTEPAAFERANYMRVLSSFDEGESAHTAISDKLTHPVLAASTELWGNSE